jgi:hypothetical protein
MYIYIYIIYSKLPKRISVYSTTEYKFPLWCSFAVPDAFEVTADTPMSVLRYIHHLIPRKPEICSESRYMRCIAAMHTSDAV